MSSSATRRVLVDLGSCSGFGAPLRDRRDCLALQDFAAEHCTLSYRAPELWQPQIGDARRGAADIFALGALCWALAFGYSPFESELRRTRTRDSGVVAFARVECAGAAAAVVHMPEALPGLLLSVDRGGAAAVCGGASSRPDARDAPQLLRGLAAGGEAVRLFLVQGCARLLLVPSRLRQAADGHAPPAGARGGRSAAGETAEVVSRGVITSGEGKAPEKTALAACKTLATMIRGRGRFARAPALCSEPRSSRHL